MSDDRTAGDMFRETEATLGSGSSGRASDVLDAERMRRRGEQQDREREQLIDDLNRGGDR